MSVVLLAVGIAAAAGLLAFVGYKFGARGKALAVKYEQEGKQLYIEAHSKVSAKLASVKAEVVKAEGELKAKEQGFVTDALALVARLKALL